jgi:hypothetical protein
MERQASDTEIANQPVQGDSLPLAPDRQRSDNNFPQRSCPPWGIRRIRETSANLPMPEVRRCQEDMASEHRPARHRRSAPQREAGRWLDEWQRHAEP